MPEFEPIRVVERPTPYYEVTIIAIAEEDAAGRARLVSVCIEGTGDYFGELVLGPEHLQVIHPTIEEALDAGLRLGVSKAGH